MLVTGMFLQPFNKHKLSSFNTPDCAGTDSSLANLAQLFAFCHDETRRVREGSHRGKDTDNGTWTMVTRKHRNRDHIQERGERRFKHPDGRVLGRDWSVQKP